ncbi:MAG: arylesterase [Bacteroidota bacterium]
MRLFAALTAALVLAGCQDVDPEPASGRAEAPPPGATASPESPPPLERPAPEADDPEAGASDEVVVLFFGDSLTAGYGLDNPDADAYPALVGAQIAEAGVPVRVVNAGVSGETTAGGRGRIDWALRQTRPDVFVLALGGNDGLRGLPPEAMEENLGATLAAVREAAPGARLVVAGMEAPPNMGDAYTSRFRAAFPSVAEAYDATLVPFLLEGVAGVARLNQPDGIHPTPAGQQVMAETVAEVVVPLAEAAHTEAG